MVDEKILNAVREEIFKVSMINTHDHIETQKKIMEISKSKSYLYDLMLLNDNNGILSYLPDEAWRMAQFDFGEARGDVSYSGEADLSKLWKKLEPVMKHARASNHYRMFMKACNDLFNLDYNHIDSEEKWIELSEKISQANQREDWYRYVLNEKANIETTIVVGRPTPEVEKEYFKAAINVGDFLAGYDDQILSSLKDKYKYDGEVKSFDDYLNLLEKAFKTITSQGAVAIKDCVAYTRSLDFNNVTKRDALKGFEPVEHQGWALKSISPVDIKNFQDYMMFQIAKCCSKYNIPFQIHTGPPAPTIGSNPMKLVELIEANPDTKFVILHAGGPYANEFAVTAKFNSNVYIDFAWMLTGYPGPTGLKRLLSEWLEIMPWDKFTWGADCAVVEETYGTLLTARKVLSEVLAEKVQEGFTDIDSAVEIGKGILRNNALDLYQL